MFDLSNLRRLAGRQQGLWPWLVALVLSAVIVGCGGGGTDTAGNGVGVGGTGAAAGPVSGYGSIIVNGVRFDFSGASFTTEDADDGAVNNVATDDPEGELTSGETRTDRPVELGTMVSVNAGAISNDGTYALATASKVMLISAIRGPVQAINGSTLTVLGQKVKTDAGTWYASSHGLSTLNGQNVVVYGDYDPADRSYKASRVEYRNDLLTYKVRGPISGLSVGQRGGSFKLGAINGQGGITITYSADRVRGDRSLVNGQMVRVRMLKTPMGDGSTYVALVVAPTAASLSNVQQSRLAGVASEVNTGTKRLEINEVTVNYGEATVVNGVQPADGARVEVEGPIRNGVLMATKLTVKSEADDDLSKVRLIDQITEFAPGNVDKTVGSFKMKGLTVNYDAVSNPSVLDNGLSAAALQTGLPLDVEGNRSANDPGVIVATRIRRLTSGSR